MEEKIECGECKKEFSTKEALEQHNSAKHEKVKKEFKLPKKHIVIAAVAIVVALVIYAFLASTPAYVPATEDSDNFIGAENAPVVMVEYSDFQCPFCGKFYKETEPQIISEYVDTGKVKFVYKHLPLAQIHAYSQKAAEASECAADQGKFWEYHDKLFANQNALFPASLKKYASDAGIDRAKFDACLDSGAMASRVSYDAEEAIQKGARSTPNFFVNGVKIEGARPFASFRDAIEAELKKS